MRRTMLSLIAFAALSAWVSAQGPSPLSAEVQVKQFKSNRILIGSLVDRGIDLSNADNPLKRAEACQQTAQTLALYLERAAGRGRRPRRGVRQPLRRDHPRRPGAEPGRGEEVHSRRLAAVGDLQNSALMRPGIQVVRQSIPTTGKVGDSDKVKAALAVIEELMSKLGGRGEDRGRERGGGREGRGRGGGERRKKGRAGEGERREGGGKGRGGGGRGGGEGGRGGDGRKGFQPVRRERGGERGGGGGRVGGGRGEEGGRLLFLQRLSPIRLLVLIQFEPLLTPSSP